MALGLKGGQAIKDQGSRGYTANKRERALPAVNEDQDRFVPQGPFLFSCFVAVNLWSHKESQPLTGHKEEESRKSVAGQEAEFPSIDFFVTKRILTAVGEHRILLGPKA